MADLLTHYATGHLAGKLLKAPEERVFLYVGCLLPDIIFKALLYGTSSDELFCDPSHSPVVLVFICYVIAMLFEESIRPKVFSFTLIGSYLHVAFDACKDYFGMGVVPLFFPFSLKRVELGLYQIDHSLYFMPFAIVLIVIAELVAHLGRYKGK